MAQPPSTTVQAPIQAGPSLLPGAPGFAPRAEIQVDGKVVPALQTDLVECAVEHRRSTPACCTATFSNWGETSAGTGYLHFGRTTFDFGKRFAVMLGTAGLFRGRIAALEGVFTEGAVPLFRMTAEDDLGPWWDRNGFRTFADVSDADVIGSLAAEYGLALQSSLRGPRRPLIAQSGESDLEFLRARLEALGAYAWIDARGRLCTATKPGGREAAMVVTYGATLRSFRAQADLRGQATRTTANGRDARTGAPVTATVDQAVIAGEIPAGATGGAALRAAAFGEADRRLARPLAGSVDEAQSIARIAFADRARSFLTGVADVALSETLPGRRLDVRGAGPLFSGLYRIEAVTHRFDLVRGWRTELTVERPWLGAP